MKLKTLESLELLQFAGNYSDSLSEKNQLQTGEAINFTINLIADLQPTQSGLTFDEAEIYFSNANHYCDEIDHAETKIEFLI